MINGNIPHHHITGAGTGNHLVIPTLQKLIMNTIAVSEVKKCKSVGIIGNLNLLKLFFFKN